MQQTDPPTSMRGLARRIGVHYQSIQYLCAPDRNAKGSRHTFELARALGVSPRWLASGKGNPFRHDHRGAILDALETVGVLLDQLQRIAEEMEENGTSAKHAKPGKKT
ncbi:hypothetical protein K7G19_07375 [Cupriavidus sp. DB3]|uniref:hypothetical protein n=1 Tax=Cupriavidus sp. DB3 TaxID=2873259 RepID=UPI001CF1268D|nr:hypothetical protein [Cupriavidus sp. DB3]MCA7083419.1 hypothetical protein [Cupriavidus sp. DB3]